MPNCNPWGNDTQCDCWWSNGTRVYDVFNIERLLSTRTMRLYGSPHHIAWRPGVQSSHLTVPALFEQCEFNPNAEVMDPHQDAFWNDSIWGNVSAAAERGGFKLGWGLRTTEEILTPDNESATIVLDPAQASGYRINPGQCVNFEGFFGDEIGNASSPDSNGRGISWGNLLGAQTDRLVAVSHSHSLQSSSVRSQCRQCLLLPHASDPSLALNLPQRFKTLVGRGMRAFCELEPCLSPEYV
jgi:hypothetical protein